MSSHIEEREIVVLGGGVGGLVAANKLARAGHDVLIISRALGGSFRPLQIGGREVPLGPRYLELGYEDDPSASPPLGEYVPGVKGHRPFTRDIRHFLLVELGIEVQTVSRMYVQRGSTRTPDFLFTVDLRGAPAIFSEGEIQRVSSQALEACEKVGAAGVTVDNDKAMRESVAWASLANHGKVFHDVIVKSLGNKIAPNGIEETLSPFARKLWLTLFHPGTLHSAFAGEAPFFRPKREFFAPLEGFGGVIHRLESGITGAGGEIRDTEVKSVDSTNRSFSEIELASGARLRAEQIVFASDGRESGFVNKDVLDAFETHVAWLSVNNYESAAASTQPELVHIVDADVPLYRLSNSPTAPDVYCLEYSGVISGDEVPKRAEDDLRRHVPEFGSASLSLLRSSTAKQLRYSGVNIERMKSDLRKLHRVFANSQVYFTGGLAAIGADSLNEQIVQGLQISDSIESKLE